MTILLDQSFYFFVLSSGETIETSFEYRKYLVVFMIRHRLLIETDLAMGVSISKFCFENKNVRVEGRHSFEFDEVMLNVLGCRLTY